MLSNKAVAGFVAAVNIDEVLERLTGIIDTAVNTKNRAGYFASLYRKMTLQIKDGIAKGDFENAARMEMLDVCFANRYLLAHYQLQCNERTSASWDIAFKTCRKSKYILLQHLLLGINAHINFDLGIAAVETMEDKNLSSMRKDFNAINAIIGSLIYEIINELMRVCPLLSLLGYHAGNSDLVLVQFSITNARDGAWCFAEELSQCNKDTYPECIRKRDKDVEKLGTAIIIQHGLVNFTLWIIHIFEWKQPDKIIRVISDAKRNFFKVDK